MKKQNTMSNGGGISGTRAAELAKIYSTGTAQQLWEAWTPDNRMHFLIDHSTEFFELMDEDYNKSSNSYSILSYDTLPSPIRKSVIIHHAQGMYGNGGGIGTFKNPNIKMSDTLYQDMATSSLKVIDYIGKEKVAESYKNKPAATMWDIYHEVSLQKNNSNHPSLDNGSGRRVISYDPSFRAQTDALYDTHIQSAMKNIFKQIFDNNSMAEGGLVNKGDLVHVPIRNKSGFVLKVGKNLVNVKFVNGETESFTFDEIKKIEDEEGGPMAEGGEVLEEKRRVIKKLMSDENFLTNLSIKQSVAFMDRIDRAKSKKEINELIGNAQKTKRMNEGGEITSFRDIPYNEVLDYADEKALNTETEGNFKEAAQALFNEKYSTIQKKLVPVKKKLLDRINTLKSTMANANAAAQKSIQKKIDVLQKQFDYNPSSKERAQANKGKYALDVPGAYSKGIYKKLWSMKIFPRIHKLNGTASIVVNSQINLDKAYKVYSDMLKEKKEKVPPLSRISRKL